MSKLINLRANVLDTPLMITRAKLREILGVIGPRMDIELDSLSLIPEPGLLGMTPRLPAKNANSKSGVAVIPIQGTLVHRGANMNALSGLRSYDSIRADFDRAMNDPAISQIVLDIDSPGGEVAGAFDLADHIQGSRGMKPITASVNEHAFSAAYLLASASDKIYLSRTAGVGSIGVVALHEDRSKKDEQEGVKFTTIYAGDKKVDMNPHSPLTDEAKADIQVRVDKIYDLFVSTVARNNGVNEKTIRDTKAGLYMGEDAISAGLADGIKSFDQVLSDIQSNGGKNDMAIRGENQIIEDLNEKVRSLEEIRDNLQARIAELEKESDDLVFNAIEEATQTTLEAERVRILEIVKAGVLAHAELEAIEELIRTGATVDDAKSKFMEDMESDTRMRNQFTAHPDLDKGMINPLIADAEKRAQSEG